MAHVTFIHGIANKPEPDVLLRIWRDSLARDGGLDLGSEGVTSSMVYWADVLYREPKAEAAEHESDDSFFEKSDEDIDLSWQIGLEGDELAWTEDLAAKLNFDAEPPHGDEDFRAAEADIDVAFERIPLPWWAKRRLMKAFLRDVHHYLFNVEYSPRPGVSYQVRDEIRRRLIEALEEGASQPGPHVIVSHSMGTVISYDCLKRVASCPRVDALITIGSPLGLDEIQDQLKPEWSREQGFPDERTDRWVNVFDPLDPVAGLDPELANDYKRDGAELIRDVDEPNRGLWRHNISNYLGGPQLRSRLRRLLDLDEGNGPYEHAGTASSKPAGAGNPGQPSGAWDPRGFRQKLTEATEVFDREQAGSLCDELIRHVRRSDTPYDESEAKKILNALRRKRYFDLMERVADAFIQTGQRAPQIRRQYAQALLDQGSLSAAISWLGALVDDTVDNPRENVEARGLLGRAHKQMYVDADDPTTSFARDALSEAVRWYFGVYEAAPSNRWHGINSVALLRRAVRDHVPVEGQDDPAGMADEIARRILGEVEELWDAGNATLWDSGTAAEACVALGKDDEALRWMVRYVDAPGSDAFELSSTYRQLTEVWQLTAGREPGSVVLPVLRAELLQKRGAELPVGNDGLEPGVLGELGAEKLEKILGSTRYLSYQSMLEAIERGHCVAKIEDQPDSGFGTGFLMCGADLHSSLGDGLVLVTNAHVVSKEPGLHGALGCQEAIVACQFLGGRPGRQVVGVKELIWTSPPDKLDATVLKIDRQVEAGRYPLAANLPTLGAGEDEQRVYIIGHPKGGALAFSMQDNLLLDHEGPPGGAPPDPEVVRLHYRSPTEGGMSGSPVFNRQWKLIGLHHAGHRKMGRLNGQPGTYPANEGLWIQSIIAKMSQDLP